MWLVRKQLQMLLRDIIAFHIRLKNAYGSYPSLMAPHALTYTHLHLACMPSCVAMATHILGCAKLLSPDSESSGSSVAFHTFSTHRFI